MYPGLPSLITSMPKSRFIPMPGSSDDSSDLAPGVTRINTAFHRPGYEARTDSKLDRPTTFYGCDSTDRNNRPFGNCRPAYSCSLVCSSDLRTIISAYVSSDCAVVQHVSSHLHFTPFAHVHTN